MLVDPELPRTVHCRNNDAIIPAGVIRIFTSNCRNLADWLGLMNDDGEIKISAKNERHYEAIKGGGHSRRRVYVVHVEDDLRNNEEGAANRARKRAEREARAEFEAKWGKY